MKVTILQLIVSIAAAMTCASSISLKRLPAANFCNACSSHCLACCNEYCQTPNAFCLWFPCCAQPDNDKVGSKMACKVVMESKLQLTTPMIASNLLGDSPRPTATPPMDGLDEVTYGYVPKSRSSIVALAPSMRIFLPVSYESLIISTVSPTYGKTCNIELDAEIYVWQAGGVTLP